METNHSRVNRLFRELSQARFDDKQADVSALQGQLYEALLRLTRAAVYKCYGHVDEEVAATVAGDILIKAHKFRGESAFSTWAHAVAYNAALSAVRKRGAWKFLTDKDVLDGLSSGANVHMSLVLKQLRESLSPEQRVLLDEITAPDVNMTELAAHYGLSRMGLHKRVQKLKGRLRELWRNWPTNSKSAATQSSS